MVKIYKNVAKDVDFFALDFEITLFWCYICKVRRGG